MTNGLTTPCGSGLVGALTYFGLDAIDAADKESMRQLALRGGNYSESEKQALLNYCESDVDALARLLPVMLPEIDLAHTLLRGRYMKAAALMEHNGNPIDTDFLTRLQRYWAEIQEKLIAEIDRDYGVFDGRSFKSSRFADWWLNIKSLGRCWKVVRWI